MSNDLYSPILTDFLIRAAKTVVSQGASLPFLRTQLILQSQTSSSHKTSPYTSTIDVLSSLSSTSGTLSLYRGTALALSTSYLTSTFQLLTRAQLKPLLFSRWDDGYPLFLLGQIISSALISTASQLLFHPLSYTYLRLAVDTEDGAVFPATKTPYQFPTTQDVVKKTYDSDGVAGFYRGIVPAILHTVVRSTSFFVFRDFVFGPALDASSWKGGKTATIVTMALIACAADFISYPLSTVIVKMDLESCSKKRPSTMRDATWQIAQTQGGYIALWKGVGAYIAYTMTATGVLYAFELFSGL